MTSSYNINRSSAALSLIALLLFAASTPLLVHSQMTGNPLSMFSTLISLLSGLTGSLLPSINLLPIISSISQSPLPTILNVSGQVTCPGLGTGVSGVPVNLTCLTRGLQVLRGQSVTNANGSFAVNATVSPVQAVGLISTLLPNNTISCLTSTPVQLIQSVVSCPTLTNATSMLVSMVQLTGQNVFSLTNRVLNANATASTTA